MNFPGISAWSSKNLTGETRTKYRATCNDKCTEARSPPARISVVSSSRSNVKSQSARVREKPSETRQRSVVDRVIASEQLRKQDSRKVRERWISLPCRLFESRKAKVSKRREKHTDASLIFGVQCTRTIPWQTPRTRTDDTYVHLREFVRCNFRLHGGGGGGGGSVCFRDEKPRKKSVYSRLVSRGASSRERANRFPHVRLNGPRRGTHVRTRSPTKRV